MTKKKGETQRCIKWRDIESEYWTCVKFPCHLLIVESQFTYFFPYTFLFVLDSIFAGFLSSAQVVQADEAVANQAAQEAQAIKVNSICYRNLS